MSTLLEVKDLAVGFTTRLGILRAVDGVSFTVQRSGSLAVVGESGCGKSALSLALMGLLPGNGRLLGGSIHFAGQDLAGLAAADRRALCGRRIALVFQDPMTSLNPWMRIGEQVAEQIRLHQGLDGRAARRRSSELFASVGIPDPERSIDKYPHECSGGQRQRVLIAMALSCDPDLLIADEPTTALDVTVQAQVLGLIRREQQRRGMGLILITHNLGVAKGMCERVAVMYAGRLVETAPAAELFAAPRHPYAKGLLAALPRLNTDREQPLVAIPGQPPRRIDPQPGCPFADRCALVQDDCRRRDPPLQLVSADHAVACPIEVGP